MMKSNRILYLIKRERASLVSQQNKIGNALAALGQAEEALNGHGGPSKPVKKRWTAKMRKAASERQKARWKKIHKEE